MKKIRRGNIYSKIPAARDAEIFQPLLADKRVKIERIVSRGQRTPKGEWLKDACAEWVMVLKGAGTLRFQRGNGLMRLKAGDYVFIPAGTSHRVEQTSSRERTVWLAVKAC